MLQSAYAGISRNMVYRQIRCTVLKEKKLSKDSLRDGLPAPVLFIYISTEYFTTLPESLKV